MVKQQLHEFVDQHRIRAAIAQAERVTDAPIAVSVAPHVKGDLQHAAMRALHRRGLGRARDRNAVHFFVVPSRREFAIVGDAGAHERLGQAAWDHVAATVEQHFRAGDPTGGLVAGIQEIAEHLGRHFPRKAGA